MSQRAGMVELRAAAAVLTFDPDPATPPARALLVLTLERALPVTEVGAQERFSEAAHRVATAAAPALGGRSGLRGDGLRLVGLEDGIGRRRTVVAWYAALVAHREPEGPGTWSPFGRGARSLFPSSEMLGLVTRHLHREARSVGGAAALLGDVFTADDIFRLYTAVHGEPEGSERTFRRRIQELRDGGLLRPVRASDVDAIRARTPRFRSPSGTGGRPPELLRYAGGGEAEQLTVLRSRRAR